MGELSTLDLRELADGHPLQTDGPQIRAALRWAADRIDYLEGFIEGYEQEMAAEQRHKALDELTAEAQAMGFYDSPKPGGSKEGE